MSVFDFHQEMTLNQCFVQGFYIYHIGLICVLYYDDGEGHMNIRGAGAEMDFYPASPI